MTSSIRGPATGRVYTCMTIRYRYDGTFPIMYLVVWHLILQGYQIMSTCAFVNMRKYPQYIGQLGRIRNKGFDIIVYDKRVKLFIGIEVKPEFSGIEFKHALGQTLFDLTETNDRVDIAIIVMPHKDHPAEHLLKNKINVVLKSYDFPISIKYLPLSCRTYPPSRKTFGGNGRPRLNPPIVLNSITMLDTPVVRNRK